MLGQGLLARLHGAVAGVLGRVGGCYRAGAVQACPGVAAVSLVWESRAELASVGAHRPGEKRPWSYIQTARQPSTCQEP